MKYALFIIAIFVLSCTQTNSPIVPLDNFKGTVVSEKQTYTNFGRVITERYFILKVKGKKQSLQTDSFYYQKVSILKVDYDKYQINDTIK